MILSRNSRRILFRELAGDQYYIKSIPQNSVKYMFDIGANVGLISILARLIHPKIFILAIEPHTKYYEQLVINTNNLLINTRNIALGTGSPFYLIKERSNNLCNCFSEEKSSNTKIESQTLSSLVSEYSVDPNDLFLKIDIEGAERFLLKDTISLDILKTSKVIAFEVHNKYGNDPAFFIKEMISFLNNTHHYRVDKKQTNLVFLRKDFYDFQ